MRRGKFPLPASRLREAIKRIAELLLPGDVRDIPQAKDRALTIWERLKKVCAEGTTNEENEESEGLDENPFV